MFNKKYKELEKRIKELEEDQTDYQSCEICKCHGDTKDFKKVTLESLNCRFWGTSSNYCYEYYCLKCSPGYDYVNRQDLTAVKYYKTIGEHKEEVINAVQKNKTNPTHKS